ncbi:MAG: GNAT family N-acetyltransferase [Clostridiales bacterium]|jgi:ribosomal protein S18 acetylase RimI-like enzyme|nr:GNAT family N-acetyltransferase [Clostridiales bacterium]
MEYSFIIRKAVREDADAIYGILKNSVSEYIERSGIPLPLDAMLESVEAIERGIEAADVFIAIMDGIPVGTVRVALREGAPALLSKLGVVSGYHNIGIGKSLMNLVDKVLSERGVASLELYTAAKNANIMRFYYGRGFYVDSTAKERGYIRALMRKDYAPDARKDA